MIKRRLVIFILAFITVLALSTASAGAFSSFWNKITGNVPTDEDPDSCTDTDGPNNFNVAGVVFITASGETNAYTDYCIGDTAYDYYCSEESSSGGSSAVFLPLITGYVTYTAQTTSKNCLINALFCTGGKCGCNPGDTKICAGSTIGECWPGTETCDSNGDWDNNCIGFQGHVNEICDGLDNNCDGVVDEGCTPPECSDGAVQNCGTNVGLCIEGSQTCIDGAWDPTPCVPIQDSTTEICDGFDNDCDGFVDEGDVCPIECTDGQERTCPEGNNVGECLPGTETCVDGEWNNNCEGAKGPTNETCDTLDNDCNGIPDDGDVCDNCSIGDSQECSGSSVGACWPGTKTCSGGSWGICVGFVGQTTEICDGVNNDCDGDTDEDINGDPLVESCGINAGECVQGIRTCGPDLWGTCGGDYIGPVDEICDGKDNDCDGVVDEGCGCTDGTSRDCGTDTGECTKGTQVCTNSEWGTLCLNSQGESSEICDQKDNDCDGLVDEGNACDDDSIVNLQTTNAATCEDTDDKDDLYVKGEVTATTFSGDTIFFEDECLNSKQVAQYSCFRDPDTNDLFLQQKGYNCPSGFFCKEGICESSSGSTGTTTTECINSDTVLPLSINKVCFNKNTRDVQITLSKDNPQTIDYLDFFITDNERDVSILTCGNTCGGCEVISSGTKSYYIYIENEKKTPTSLILKSTNCLTDITRIGTC